MSHPRLKPKILLAVLPAQSMNHVLREALRPSVQASSTLEYAAQIADDVSVIFSARKRHSA